MKVDAILNKLSGALFFSGFMLSKLQYVPVPFVSVFFKFFSLNLYMLGYAAWFYFSYLQPEYKELQDKWYGFAKIKEQFLLSSFIGFTGALISIGAAFLPVLLPLAACCFLLGNIFWTIGEFHKYNNPPITEDNFSLTRQQSYVSYAAGTTSISFVVAMSSILITAFPLVTIPVTFFSLVLCAGLGALTFDFWLDANFGNHRKVVPTSSSSTIIDRLGVPYQEDHRPSSRPLHSKVLFEDIELQNMGDSQDLIETNSSGYLATTSV